MCGAVWQQASEPLPGPTHERNDIPHVPLCSRRHPWRAQPLLRQRARLRGSAWPALRLDPARRRLWHLRDPERIDRATRKHDDLGDFPTWLDDKHAAPRPTLFIKGNHEDFDWLDTPPAFPVLPGLFRLHNGHTMELGTTGSEAIRVGGIGGYGPSHYPREARHLQDYAKRHYTFDEIQRLFNARRIDILLTHDASKGFQFDHHGQGRNFVGPAEGLDTLLARTRPRVCFSGHHHTRVDGEVSGTRCIGLNIVGRSSHLAAFEMTADESEWSILDEF